MNISEHRRGAGREVSVVSRMKSYCRRSTRQHRTSIVTALKLLRGIMHPHAFFRARTWGTMVQPMTPRGRELHKKRIACDTAEWHRRLEELVEILCEAAAPLAAPHPQDGEPHRLTEQSPPPL